MAMIPFRGLCDHEYLWPSDAAKAYGNKYGLCPACRQALGIDDLPPITGGSDRQIRWAEHIRDSAIMVLISMSLTAARRQGVEVVEHIRANPIAGLLAKAASTTDARWWCNHSRDAISALRKG